ncbi:MAG TPA: hypothetical protein DCZ23_00860 [Lachnospiraceae bacterium]|nr:hypothetical protein [Lachnospiraceae bacterium]
MKKIKCIIFMTALLLTFQAGSVSVMAAVNKTPAGIVAELTGKSIDDVINEKMDTGKTYGRIAKENGKLKEFKAECLKLKEAILKEDVANGLLSQAEADSILSAIKAKQTVCDGYGAGHNKGYGRGYNGAGHNKGYGRGCNGTGKRTF